MTSVLHRMRLSHKLLILGLVALVMVALPLSLYVTDVLGNLRHARSEATGMPPMMAVNAAVQQMQVHRGTAAGMLGGDATMAARRDAVRETVHQRLAQAQQALAQAEAPPELRQQLDQLVQRWKTLEQAVASRSIRGPDSMAQHTQLVVQLLLLNEALLHTYALNTTARDDSQAMIQALLTQAPLLSEGLGLLRGQGAGFLAQGTLPPENRGSLRALHGLCEALCDHGRALLRRDVDLCALVALRLRQAVCGDANFHAVPSELVGTPEGMPGSYSDA
jgi:hypothetical protein